jgi:hypothetical protein
MTVETWEVERSRAWTALFVMYSANYSTHVAAGYADVDIKQWEMRFPKPQAKQPPYPPSQAEDL